MMPLPLAVFIGIAICAVIIVSMMLPQYYLGRKLKSLRSLVDSQKDLISALNYKADALERLAKERKLMIDVLKTQKPGTNEGQR